MKNLFVAVITIASILSFNLYAENRSFSTRGNAENVRQNRRMKEGVSNHFCFPVGDCHAHYSYKDAQPFLTYNSSKNGLHLGEDWNRGSGNDDYGDPVYSAGAGIVTFSTDLKGSWGKCIITTHTTSSGNTVNFLYAHLKDSYVKYGDTVALHQKIGTIGTANGLYSAHLHFEGRYGEYNQTVAGFGYSTDWKILKNFFNPTEFIKSRLPKPFTSRPGSPCYSGVKKAGNVLKCEKTAQGGVVTAGETLSPLVTIDNVWVHHMFEVKVYFNNQFKFQLNTKLNFVDDEYGWSVSQAHTSITNATVGVWKFEFSLVKMFADETGKEKEYIGEVSYIVVEGPKNNETNANSVQDDAPNQTKKTSSNFLLKSVEVCKDFSGGANTDWVYQCKNPTDVYKEGDSAFILVGIMNVPKSHRFIVDAYQGTAKKWSYTSQWNFVSSSAPWNWAYTWPSHNNMSSGSWTYKVTVQLQDGTLIPVVEKSIWVNKKSLASSSSNSSSGNSSSSSNSSSDEPKETTKKSSSEKSNSSSSSSQQSSSAETNSSTKQTYSSPAPKQSKEAYKYQWSKVCSSVSSPTTDWTYSCIGEKSTFQSGVGKVYLLTKISDVWATHSFTIKVYKEGMYQWQWTSNSNVVNESTGWTQAFFFPYIANPGDGSWKVDVYINTKYGSKLLSSPTFTVGNKTSYQPAPSNQQSSQEKEEKPKESSQSPKQNAEKNNSAPSTPSYQPKPVSGASTGTYSFQSVSACKSVSSVGTCNGEGYFYEEGASVHFRVAMQNVSHSFQIKISGSNNSGGSWSWTSGIISATEGPITKYVTGIQNNISAGSWFYTISIKLSTWNSYKVVGQTDLIVK